MMDASSTCVALTGGTGFVGRHVLRRLLDQGYHVRALCRDASRTPQQHANLDWIQGDISDATSLIPLLHDADAVIHLVGIIEEKPQFEQTFESVHVDGTRHVVDACRHVERCHRMVHMSALGTREDAKARYHRTKWQAEQLVRNSGLDWTIVRPSLIHGHDGAFTQMLRGFWRDGFPPLVVPYFAGGLLGLRGSRSVQPVWVEDVARVFVDALRTQASIGETYDLPGPDRLTWPQLYRAVGRHVPHARRKKTMPVPGWWAKCLAHLPFAPFTHDQVTMALEDNTGDPAPVQRDFGFTVAPFETTLAKYAQAHWQDGSGETSAPDGQATPHTKPGGADASPAESGGVGVSPDESGGVGVSPAIEPTARQDEK